MARFLLTELARLFLLVQFQRDRSLHSPTHPDMHTVQCTTSGTDTYLTNKYIYNMYIYNM